ncbi:chromate efflux transporter [Dongia sp.]|uniref:chromate efflux transporter n=1 Tax=Dongia sp. TaxID=1977262 RepID=UPI0037522200
MQQGAPPVIPSFGEALRVWAKVGLLSFGGPAGQIALMHRMLVDEKRWIGEHRFLHALSYCMLLPGPEAQQLAVYIGWLLHGVRGGLAAGILFVLPGAVVMLVLSAVYALYHDLPALTALFLGVKAVVLAIVIEAILRIGRRALKNRVAVAIAVAAFIGIYVLKVPFPLIVLGAGLLGWMGHRVSPAAFPAAGGHGNGAQPDTHGLIDTLIEGGGLTHTRRSTPRALRTLALWLALWIGPILALRLVTGGDSIWTNLGQFFSVMAVVTFGGAYAVLAYVAQAAVDGFHWLLPHEMVDGLGLAETTPGPLILVLQFVGFLAAFRAHGALDPLLAGTLGAALVLWATFAPCFLWIFVGAPYVEALRNNQAISAALAAVTAAVVGVIANLAVWFGLHVLFGATREVPLAGLSLELPVFASVNWITAAIALAAVIAMLRFRVGALPTLAFGALAGLVTLWL